MSAISSVSSAAIPSPDIGYQRAMYERQLADWTHCASAKTPYGKAKIEDLTTRLSEIASQVQRAEAARDAAAPAAGTAPAPASTAQPVASRPTATLGHDLDVYA